MIDCLNDEKILFHIFSYLYGFQVVPFCTVCKKWNNTISSELFWRHCCESEGIGQQIHKTKYKDKWKHFYKQKTQQILKIRKSWKIISNNTTIPLHRKVEDILQTEKEIGKFQGIKLSQSLQQSEFKVILIQTNSSN